MTTRILILSALLLATLGWGKDYAACKDLKGPEKDVCSNIEFSKERLIQNSEADQYAQRSDSYLAPNSEGDGRSGTTLVGCDKQRNACVTACKNDASCREGCLHSYTSCAGTATTSSVGLSGAERPDGYTVEFNDDIAKTQ